MRSIVSPIARRDSMVSRPTRLTPPVECVRLYDAEAGLDGVIVIHSTALGPGAGGCRFWSYPDLDAAVADAMRLAEGMSYKNVLSGLPLGGATAGTNARASGRGRVC